jgi:triacylglycerol lipase
VDTLLSTGWFALLAKFAGLAATALAVCLGAPFWFDVMGRLVKLRSSAGSDAEKSKSSSTANAGASPTGSNPPPNTGLAPASVGSSASTPAALAIAKPLPLATAAIAPVVHPSHVVARAYWLAEFADHAYETNPTLLAIWLQQHGFTVKQCFSDPKTDTQGFLAVAGSVAVLSFRGTEKKLSDWLTDANADQIADPAGIVPGGLHQGFITAFNSVAAAVDAELDALKAAGATLHITGHSLGAALATLAALHCEGRAKSAGLVSSVHTFGSPRVGDTVFAAAFERALRNRAFRFVNNEDLVTRVPPPDLPFGAKTLRYEHVGEMKFIDPQGKLMGEVSFMFRLLNFTTNALGDMKQAVATTVKDHSMALYCAHLRNNF